MYVTGSRLARVRARVADYRELSRVRRHVAAQGIWFVDVPRTSSSFVQANLGAACGFPYGKREIVDAPELSVNWSRLAPSHMPAFRAREMLGARLWNRIETFSVMRQPMCWALSFWRFLVRYRGEATDFSEFLKMLEANVSAPPRERPNSPRHFLQSDYLLDPDDGTLILDRIFRFDDHDNLNRYLGQVIRGPLPYDEPLTVSRGVEYMPTQDERLLAERLLAPDLRLWDKVCASGPTATLGTLWRGRR